MKATEIHPKVAAGSLAGAITIIIVFVAEKLGLEVPAEVASAFTVILSFAAGYMKNG